MSSNAQSFKQKYEDNGRRACKFFPRFQFEKSKLKKKQQKKEDIERKEKKSTFNEGKKRIFRIGCHSAVL